MEPIFWAALGFLVASAIVGTAYVGVRAWRAWHAFVSLAVAGAAGIDVLTARVEQVAAKAERAAAGVAELQAAADRLARSRARARVLIGAAEDVLGVVRAVASFRPSG